MEIEVVSEIWKNIIVAVVSFLLAILGQQYFLNKQNEIQKIDIHTSFDNSYLSKPKFPDSKIEIKVDGKTKESIGLLEVSLVNFSNNVFKDVPIIIEVKPRKGDSFTYLSHFAYGEKSIKDLVEETKPYELDNGVYRFSYKAISLNRSEEANVSMKLGVLFEGQEEPDVVVSAVGINTREFNIENSPARAKVQRDAFILLVTIVIGFFALFFIVLGPIISRLTSPLDRKNDKRYAKQIYDVLQAESHYSELSETDLKEHVADFLYKRQLNWWETKSKFGKWLLGMRDPQPEDYKI
jgi:hypothetical protein